MKRGGKLVILCYCVSTLRAWICVLKDTGYSDVSTEFLNYDPVMTKRRVSTRVAQATLALLRETDKYM